MKTKVTYEPKFNFHNSPPITLILDIEKTCDWAASGEVVFVSKSQMKRIENHFCGMNDCRCPKGEVQQLDAEGDHFGVPLANIEAS